MPLAQKEENLLAAPLDRGDAGDSACRLCGSDKLEYLGEKASRAIFSCLDCGLVFIDPFPARDDLKAYYEKRFWDDYHAKSGNPDLDKKIGLDIFLARGRMREISRYFGKGRLLDVGCSYGAMVLEARQAGFEAVGLDLSPQAVAEGRQRFGLDLRVGGLDALDREGERFDVITVIDLIEHLDDPIAELKRLGRLLAPGGLLVIETMDIDTPAFRTNPINWWGTAPDEHLFMFNPKTLTKTVEAAGYQVDWLAFPAFPDRVIIFCARQGVKLKPLARPETTLVVRHIALGDVLWATPLIRALKTQQPEAEIHVYTAHPDLFENNLYVNGVNRLPTNFIFDRRFNLKYEYAPQKHLLEGYAESAGLKFQPANPQVFITAEEDERAAEILGGFALGSKPLIGLHAGVTWPERTWDWQKWDRLALELTAELGARVVALGSKSDYKLTPWPSLKNLVGELSVRELLAVIKRLDLFVGVDSGPMHVAAAWNTPIVGLFGCVNPELRRPFGSIFEPVTAGVECSGCLARMPIPSYDAKCENGTFHCMKMITVAAVKEAVGRALEKAGRKPGWRSGGEGLACLLEDDHLEPGQDMEILTSSTGPPSLRIKRNGQAAVTMHSTKDPETEARRWADQTGGKGDAVVLGLGLGYHVAALLERTPLSAQMVVVEKEAAIFDLALRAGALGRFALDPRLRLMVGLEPVEAARRLMALDLSPGCRLAVHQSSARLSPDYYRLLERHFSAREAREG